MKIFRMLFRRSMPNGHIWRGKQRLVKEITLKDVQKLKNDFAIEEQNMFYLRHAYLTPEQSFGHTKALGKKENALLKLLAYKKPFKENIKIEQILGHLRYKEAWD